VYVCGTAVAAQPPGLLTTRHCRGDKRLAPTQNITASRIAPVHVCSCLGSAVSGGLGPGQGLTVESLEAPAAAGVRRE
jgi:hypothetical protein